MKKMHFNLREEKGASAVVVLLTVFTFICILTGILTIVLTKAQGQSKSDIRIQEIYGNDVNRVDEIYNEVLEDINKDSKRYTMTFDYNIDDKYKNDRSTDTNYKINWGQNFSIETTIRVEELNQRYLVIGSYDNNSQTELNIEINQSNQLRVFFGKNLAEFCDGTIHKDEDIKVTFSWNKSQNRFNISAKGTATNIEFSERFEMSGQAEKNLKLGCKDNRSENFNFSTIYVKGLKIKEYKRESVVIDKVTETALVRPYHTFNGWYTQKNNGTKINENITLEDNTTVYANWTRNGDVEIDGEFFTTISGTLGALSAVPENSEEYTTIKLWGNVTDRFEIPSTKKVILDCQTYILSNGTAPVIANEGYLKVVGGKITSSGGSAVINNTKNLEITGGRIEATGTRQALYNNGGTALISGDAYLSASSSERATVHNLNNGNLTITGGTIISENQQGVKCESGSLRIGIKDGNINTTSPKIQGKTYGLTSEINYYLYDGIILGKDNTVAVDKEPTSQYLEDNSRIVKSTTQVDGVTYKSLYLELVSQ